MGKFIIEGGHRLSGRVKVQGAKNAGMDGIVFTGDIRAVKDAIGF